MSLQSWIFHASIMFHIHTDWIMPLSVLILPRKTHEPFKCQSLNSIVKQCAGWKTAYGSKPYCQQIDSQGKGLYLNYYKSISISSQFQVGVKVTIELSGDAAKYQSDVAGDYVPMDKLS